MIYYSIILTTYFVIGGIWQNVQMQINANNSTDYV